MFKNCMSCIYYSESVSEYKNISGKAINPNAPSGYITIEHCEKGVDIRYLRYDDPKEYKCKDYLENLSKIIK